MKHKLERTNTTKVYLQTCQKISASQENKLWLRKELNQYQASIGVEYQMCPKRKCIVATKYECTVSAEHQKASEYQVLEYSRFLVLEDNRF